MRVMVGDCRIGFTERLLEARVMAVIETCNYGRALKLGVLGILQFL
jgi:hypothetical protein